MIIKEARIKAFGGIIDKQINFERGINLIYGENEKGKSTIQNFIRAWLFGFGNSRGNKNNLRKKYLPFSGEKMQGELLVEYKGKEYIIKRTFGGTKKDDSSIVYDGLTGEEIKDINKDEPGVYFLGINSNTFIKTLFIPQLGVSVSRDKEEQIMEKIIDVFGCGEGEVSVYKAIEKLKNSKKQLTTPRKNGELDILKNRYSKVIEEKYEAYKISERNLEKENELINKKEQRKSIREEIKKLELFKQYLKKSKLQKEYGEITTYLKKSELLKRQEEEIETELKRENGIISEDYINDLSEENKRYLTLLDLKNENEYNLNNISKKIEEENIKLNGYEIFSSMEYDLKEKLIKLNIEQENLKEKLEINKKILNSIDEEEKKLDKKRKFLGDITKLGPYISKINILFKDYENKLHELKEAIEETSYKSEVNNKNNYNILNRKFLSIFLIIDSILLGLNIALFNKNILYVIGILFLGIGIFFILSSNNQQKSINSRLKNEKNVDNLNKDIKNIEEQLDEYVHLINCNSYKNLLRAINSLENFYSLEEKVNLRIEERKLQLESMSFNKDKEKYYENKKIISSIMKLSGCDTLDEIYIQLEQYKEIKDNLTRLNIEYTSKSKELDRLIFELEEKEKNIKEKLKIMDLDHIQLVDLEMYLKEFREKILEKKDLEKALESVEETYKVLLKDRDIEGIKSELQDFLTEDISYSYESEEEIEKEIKEKSNSLIESEKCIKDLENDIKTSFLGKRSIISIEEDLEGTIERINTLEKRLLAINMAIENLENAGREIREEFGPALNEKILNIFKDITNNKYSEVKLGENYEMIVRDNSNIFNGDYLSNGANDQLYLSLRIAFIELIFKNKEVPVIFDDSFVQYDDNRREKSINIIKDRNFAQTLMFTCQSIEENILKNNNIEFNYICI